MVIAKRELSDTAKTYFPFGRNTFFDGRFYRDDLHFVAKNNFDCCKISYICSYKVKNRTENEENLYIDDGGDADRFHAQCVYVER